MTSSTDYPLSLNPVYEKTETRTRYEGHIADWIAAYDEDGNEKLSQIWFDYYEVMRTPYVTAIVYSGHHLSDQDLKDAIYNWNARVQFDNLTTIKYK